MFQAVWFVLFECTAHRTIGETVAAACAFVLKNFIHVVNVLQLRMDRVLRTGFPAEAARDAERFFDSNFHWNPTLF
jgi:hypothetical protein